MAKGSAAPDHEPSSTTMSRWPACRAYSWSTWKQIHCRSGRIPVEPFSCGGGLLERMVAKHVGGSPADVAQPFGEVFGGDPVGDVPTLVGVGVVVPGLVHGPVAPGLGDLLAEESPDEPPLLHVQHVREQLDRRPARRHPGRTTGRGIKGEDPGDDPLAVELQIGSEVVRRAAQPVSGAPPDSFFNPVPRVIPMVGHLLRRLHPGRFAGHWVPTSQGYASHLGIVGLPSMWLKLSGEFRPQSRGIPMPPPRNIYPRSPPQPGLRHPATGAPGRQPGTATAVTRGSTAARTSARTRTPAPRSSPTSPASCTPRRLGGRPRHQGARPLAGRPHVL